MKKTAPKRPRASTIEPRSTSQGPTTRHPVLYRERGLQTKAGDVTLKVPKLRRQTFETAIIERYRRREASVEEALIEMYLAGVSVRRVEDITEALWGTRVSPSTVSDLNKKIYEAIETWRNRPIVGEHPYVYLDGIVMKRTWAGEVRN
jgi:putative transposase